MDGQAADQADGVLAGADLGLRAAQRHGQLADSAAFPPQHQAGVRVRVIAAEGDVHFVGQGAQQLLAVLVGGGRRVSDSVEVVAEGEDRGPFLPGEAFGAGGLATGELGIGIGVLAEGLLPLGFQAAGDQPVVRVDSPVAAFGPGRVVAGLLGLAVPLLEAVSWPHSSRWAAIRQACRAAGASAARNAPATAASMACPPVFMCRAPRPSTRSPGPWQ